MRIRHFGLVVAILLVPSVASADGHRARAFGGVSFAKGSTLTGAHFNVERVVGDSAKQHVSLLADYSIHETNRHTLMGGATFTGQRGGASFSLRALAGGVFGDGSSNAAVAVGGAIDLGQRLNAARANAIRWGVQVQVDQIFRGGDAKNFWRTSFGVVAKFPKR